MIFRKDTSFAIEKCICIHLSSEKTFSLQVDIRLWWYQRSTLHNFCMGTSFYAYPSNFSLSLFASLHSGTYAIKQWSKKCVFVAIKYSISVYFFGIRLFTKLKLPKTIIFKLMFANCTFQIFISNSLECT